MNDGGTSNSQEKEAKEEGFTYYDIDIHEEIIPLVVLQKVTNIK